MSQQAHDGAGDRAGSSVATTANDGGPLTAAPAPTSHSPATPRETMAAASSSNAPHREAMALSSGESAPHHRAARRRAVVAVIAVLALAGAAYRGLPSVIHSLNTVSTDD